MGYCGIVVVLAYNALLWLGPAVLSWWQPGAAEAIWKNAMLIAPALVPMLIAQVGLNLAILDKKPRACAWAVFLGLIVAGALSIVLVPALQSVGAAAASLAGYAAAAAVFILRYRMRLWASLTTFGLTIVVGVLCAGVGLAGVAAGWIYGITDASLGPIRLPHGLMLVLTGNPAGATGLFAVTSLIFMALLFVLKILSVSDMKRMISAVRGKAE